MINALNTFHLAKIFGLKFRKLSLSNGKGFSIQTKSLVFGSGLAISLVNKKNIDGARSQLNRDVAVPLLSDIVDGFDQEIILTLFQ